MRCVTERVLGTCGGMLQTDWRRSGKGSGVDLQCVSRQNSGLLPEEAEVASQAEGAGWAKALRGG